MQVQNYVPDPVQAAGSINFERYWVRVRFVRKVTYLFAAAVILALATGYLFKLPISPPQAVLMLALFLLMTSGVRTLLRNNPKEPLFSGALALPSVVLTGLCFRTLVNSGYPLWSAALGILSFALYVRLCGRDLSFVGGFMLALIASSVSIAVIMILARLSPAASAMALLWNASALFYVVYDLASLLGRRRLGEHVGAVTDLFRDGFNFLGYIPRVIIHWQKHKILADLSMDLSFKSERE
jgi:hypothetical protein